MFSILICSINDVFLDRLKINIQETIKHEYELLVWHNRTDKKPISEVYNLLAVRAKYPYWCFIQEDICVQTKNRSENLLKAFEEHPKTGLIGIASSKYKSNALSGWSTGILKYDLCNIFHEDNDGKTIHLYSNPRNALFENVVNVAGVFMAIRREVWETAQFNNHFLRDFHSTDMRVLILFSGGTLSDIDPVCRC
jgi:hypothetical protein